MSVWDFRKLQMESDKNHFRPIYYLYGNENYLINESIQWLKTRVLNHGMIDFNYDVFYAPDSSISHVKDIAETLPAMCSHRLVIYKNVHQLKEKDWELLYPLFESPVESTVLVLVAEKVDKRKKSFKKISQAGAALVELNRPYENKVPQWIHYMAQQLQIKVSPEVAALILQLVGPNLSEIHGEMVKLQDYLGDRTEAKIEDVLNAVSRVRIFNVFDLANAIGENDPIRSLQCLANLLEHGQNEVGILSLIARHIRILSELKMGIQMGLSKPQLCQRAGVPNYFLQEYLNQCQFWSLDKIKSTLKAIYLTDKALKSSPLSSSIWLENFVLLTCGDKKQNKVFAIDALP